MRSADVVARRLHGQGLRGEPSGAVEESVRRLGALQAQEFAVSRWSIAQRTRDAGVAAVDRAFAEGTIVRTHVLRPTWHLAHADDVRWLLAATAARVRAMNAHRHRQLDIDEALAARSNDVLAAALEGGRQLTRPELGAALRRAGIEAPGQRLAYLVMRAELDAVIVSGAVRGRQHTYARFDERVPNARRLDPDEAVVELTRRYFAARGPATLRDFAWWSSLTVTRCRAAVDALGAELRSEEIDGRTYWFDADVRGPAPGAPAAARVDLIQGYDEILMSYGESRDLLAPTGSAPAFPDGRRFLHVILLDGRVAGRWRHEPPAKGTVVVETRLPRPFGREETGALEAAVARYGRFLGVEATVAPTPEVA